MMHKKMASASDKITLPRGPELIFAKWPWNGVKHAPVFKHTPLEHPATEVRLLQLRPGQDDDQIECKLLVCERAALSEYEAISYTWGMQHPDIFHFPAES